MIDVLRATTTAAVLCRRLGELRLVRTPAELAGLPPRDGGYAVFSELAEVSGDIVRFDNSPTQAGRVELERRLPVLVTTNGTRAVGLASQFAAEVVLGAFVNLTAVVEFARRRGFAEVAVMPAGSVKRGTAAIEDDACADAVAAGIAGRGFDVEAAIARCRLDAKIVDRRATEKDLGPDIDLAFTVDAVAVVPRVREEPGGGWYDVAAPA